jgi:threonine aldolase
MYTALFRFERRENFFCLGETIRATQGTYADGGELSESVAARSDAAVDCAAMRYFKSDNTAAVSPEILTAIAAANHGVELAYGADRWTDALDSAFGDFFGTRVRVFAVASGTAANSLALATLCPPWGTVLTHAEAHIERDECGAPEFFTGGAKLSLVGGAGAKIAAGDLAARLAWFEPHVHNVQPRMLSITQATERGAIYTPTEISALSAIARERGMAVHMDGARFANALVAQDVTAAELTWKAGVDVLSFGVIKNGGMNAEAVVFFDPERVADFEFRRKRAGQLFCKSRYASVQLLEYLSAGLWKRNAVRANGLAARIAAAAPQLLSEPCATNQVFMKLGQERIAALSAEYGFYPWGPAGSGEARFVCSWDTPDEDVDALCAALAKLR